MTHIPRHCVTIHSKKKFVLRERSSKAVFINPNELEIDEIRVDACAIETGIRCDYLVNVGAKSISVLVELKGEDVPQGLKQLEKTHEVLKENIGAQVFWIVICRRCPLASSKLQSERARIRKHFNARLMVNTKQFDFESHSKI